MTIKIIGGQDKFLEQLIGNRDTSLTPEPKKDTIMMYYTMLNLGKGLK